MASAGPPSEKRAAVAESAQPSDGNTASCDAGERSLSKAVYLANDELMREYGILEPTPLTVPRVRQAIKTAIDKLRESEIANRSSLVETLQEVLSSGRMPEGGELKRFPLTTTYEAHPPDEKFIIWNYGIMISNAGGDSDEQPIALNELQEGFRVRRMELLKDLDGQSVRADD